MNITFNIRNKGTKSFISMVVKFFEQELKLKNSTWSLDVYIKRGMALETGSKGIVTRVGPKCLLMILDSSLDIERLVITIAHEMVHVKQFAKGHIVSSLFKKTQYWRGKRVRENYYNRPWELEAFAKERILANKIFQIINKG
jgi:hypothetical protein